MIFVLVFSCLSRGPDDQGLSCGPGSPSNGKALSDGGLKAAETGEKKDRNRRRAAAQRAGSGLYSWRTEGALRRGRERPGETGASAGQGERASMVAKPRLSIGCRDLQILTES